MNITWNDVIGLAKNGRFGDIHVKLPDGSEKRGPVIAIRRGESNMIVFDTIWMARRESIADNWESICGTGVSVSDECYPYFKAGTLCFGNSAIGQFKVHQKHSGPLQPHEVSGLEGDEIRRSWAWMYDIPLDSSWEKIVDRVVHDLGADGLVSVEDQLRVQDEAARFAQAA